MRLIDADTICKDCIDECWIGDCEVCIIKEYKIKNPIDAVPVTASELKHLINDIISYIWRLEARGLDKPEYGYESRKALLEKLKQFEKEHFPEMDCACGKRKDGEG